MSLSFIPYIIHIITIFHLDIIPNNFDLIQKYVSDSFQATRTSAEPKEPGISGHLQNGLSSLDFLGL